MTTEEINEAAVNLTKSWQETNKVTADSLAAAQERNLRFVQSVFENGVEVLKNQTEDARSVMQEFVEQPQKQRGSLQTAADSAIAAQKRNLKYAQNVYENGTELLKSHADGARNLMETLVEQSHTQQEAFQTIVRESMNAYIDFLYAPFSFHQQAVETAQTITRQGVETAQGISHQGMDAAQNAARQAAEAAQAVGRADGIEELAQVEKYLMLLLLIQSL
jgi:polyhydroxyalkanoate synthesis regulator phasin